ncbi:hypothetical protein HPB51_024388 [Rhipicephalus microplus]|uniref:Uncharacterized protein n=1 Tax=Rhipicephalus microplus TaxID=6941 RepID=A0A9J6D773_RHIMP|nr:hypothetical protein HPB51_024388 [Rhipicephalus microplus]
MDAASHSAEKLLQKKDEPPSRLCGEPRRSFGTRGAAVSIASSEALDARSCELVFRSLGLAWRERTGTQAHLETLSADNARICTELSSLRAQLNRATTSERETLHEAHQNASLPTERVTTSTLGLHHSVPADITMSSGSTRPPSLNEGTNQDAARPAAPTVSTHEGEPSMAQILATLVNTQALLANTLLRGPPKTSPIQIHFTSDTSSSIPLFDGTPQQSAHE